MALNLLEKKILESNFVKYNYSLSCNAISCCECILMISDFKCTRIKISDFNNKNIFTVYTGGTALEVLALNDIALDSVEVYRLRGLYQGHLADFIVNFKELTLSIISEESSLIEFLMQDLLNTIQGTY